MNITFTSFGYITKLQNEVTKTFVICLVGVSLATTNEETISMSFWVTWSLRQVLWTCSMFSPSQPVDTDSVRALLANTKTLQQILKEAHSLLRMFWRAALPSSDSTKQVMNHCVSPQLVPLCYLKGHWRDLMSENIALSILHTAISMQYLNIYVFNRHTMNGFKGNFVKEFVDVNEALKYPWNN